MTDSASTDAAFDFLDHGQRAEAAYQRVHADYARFAEVVEDILRECTRAAGIPVASIESRAKSVNSFAAKAAQPHATHPTAPRYSKPLSEITDLAAARVITFFPKSIADVDALLRREFLILEKTDKADFLQKEEKLGYQSIHYLVKLTGSRASLAEYNRYKDLVAEVQVRTVLQHAWAEIEHDIQYKAVETIPVVIRRRFMALAGLLEIADREFQEIQDEDEKIRQAARASVNAGQLETVEITPDALKAYLDKRLGPDGRMSKSAYQFEASLLHALGFRTILELDKCLEGLNDDGISRWITNARQGQITQLELALMVAMGREYLSRHLWSELPWFVESTEKTLQKLEAANQVLGNRAPPVPKPRTAS